MNARLIPQRAVRPFPPPRAPVAGLATVPDAQAPTDWITEYLAFHPIALAGETEPTWGEFVAQPGLVFDGHVAELYRRLNHLQQRLQALEYSEKAQR